MRKHWGIPGLSTLHCQLNHAFVDIKDANSSLLNHQHEQLVRSASAEDASGEEWNSKKQLPLYVSNTRSAPV